MNTSFPQLFLLITALSLDAFAASFVYGTDRVKIPAASVAVITAPVSYTHLIYFHGSRGIYHSGAIGT